MKKIVALTLLALNTTCIYADDQPQISSAISEMKYSHLYLKQMDPLAAAMIGFGTGLLCKRHAILGTALIIAGVLHHNNSEKTGSETIKHGFTQIQTAKTFADIQNGARSIATGTCQCARDRLHEVEKLFTPKS